MVLPIFIFGQKQLRDSIYIKSEIFEIVYSEKLQQPKFIKYTVQCPTGSAPRTGMDFYICDSITTSDNKDYENNHYDKGHLAPDGDLSWDQQVEYESFLMTNMYPQAGSLNRGVWKLLETSIRGWTVQRNQSYTVYVGGLYNAQDKRIGSGVVVPHGFYKIVINNQTNEVAGWAFPHVPPYPNLGNDLTKFRLAIVGIQAAAGVKYSFPPNVKELPPGNEWPVDYGQLTNAKRAKCRISE
jgi:endonuclease G